MPSPGPEPRPAPPSLARRMGLLGLVATGVCAMMGAAINVLPIMLQRNVPGIGAHVLWAYALGAIPAIFAALAYAVLASAMPRAGGSYVFASRSLSPYLGFAASFSQWFGLSFAIGIVAYLLIPFLHDVATALELARVASFLASGLVRVILALALVWLFVVVNVLGVRLYQRILVPLMVLMFLGGGVVIVAGFGHDHADFAAALLTREGVTVPTAPAASLDFGKLVAAAAILFSSFIGFDAIAQAGGEAKRPGRDLPLAIGIAVVLVGGFYMLFTAAVYHAVPWSFVAARAQETDLTAPGLMGYLLSPGWTVAIVAGAAIALINDLPAMLLAVSRLMFAWGEDGIFPRAVARIHRRYRTPHVAIALSGVMASLGILGSHWAGDFFLGVDVLVTAMLVNFLLMCLSVLFLPRVNPRLARAVRFARGRAAQLAIALPGAALLALLLVFHVIKDLTTEQVWYHHSTWLWLLVMAIASVVFAREWRRLRARGVDLETRFAALPPE